MNIHESTETRKNSLSFASLSIAVLAVFMGLFISLFPSHREYYPVAVPAKDDADRDAGAKGEAQFFFDARKNISTNTMDYMSMLAADMAVRARDNSHNTHSSMVTSVPNFNWQSMGPNNVGGRTRAILIDNTDPTHQTIFAGGVSGGIWKSTNGGGTWGNTVSAISYSINDTMANMNVSCIAQDANGAIYIGTGEGFSLYSEGEGFSSAILGGGIFKSTNDGATWRLLPKTVPSAKNNATTIWAYVNRIAIRPDNFKVIYAATNGGLMISHDSGATWRYAYNSVTKNKLPYNSLDVKISNDGSVVVACINGYGFYCYPQQNDTMFTEMRTSGAGHLNPSAGAGRIEFAISPTNSNRIYASVISGNSLDPFQTSTLSGIFMTMTANTNGGYWYDIGPGGSLTFDPYAEPLGGDDQAYYDNTLGVPPANEAQVLCGGTTLWEWSGVTNTDTAGNWKKVSHYNGSINFFYDPLWIHPDEHAIVFDEKNPQTVFVGCDGGIFKSTNWYVSPNPAIAGASNQSGSVSSLVFQSVNRNYNVTQYYTVCFAPKTDTILVPMSINNGTGTTMVKEHLGLGGGTQDNGTPFIPGYFFPHYPNDGIDASGGDGSGAVVSQLDPNVAYFCSDLGALLRENNLSAGSTPTSAYTTSRGLNKGGNIDSVHALGGSCFVFPVALYENIYDTLNHDSLQFIAADSNYKVGNIIWPISPTGGITYPYKLTRAVKIHDTINVPDRVVSKLVVGFTGSAGGLWITGQAASTNIVVWIPFGGPRSTPNSFSGNSPIHALAWSPDGNTLYAGTEDGHFFRFSNMNSIIANNYKSGALWSNTGGGIVNSSNQVVSTDLSSILNASGRDILSISTDPANNNNVMVTLGNYGSTTYVYYSNNALSATPTFSSVQGSAQSGLPAMPVYGSVLDILDSTGHYITNSAMVATEHGIYTTSNITAGSGTKWIKNNIGMPNCLALAVKQQTTQPWLCNNSGVIYVGTHGRGLWTANNNFNVTTGVSTVSESAPAIGNLLIYPNPMTDRGNIEFNLSSADNVTVDIYDMQGKVIKTINMGSQSPGSHTVTFESTGLRAGTYFAALTGSDFRKVSKFIVIR